MIYVGIDVAKQSHFASLISSDGEILVGPFQFSNDRDGFQYLVSAFEPFDNEIIIGLESTAHYADNQIRYLVAEGYNVCVPLIHSLLLPCRRITFAKRRQIRLTLTSLPKLL